MMNLTSKPISIFVVDDDPFFLNIFKKEFTKLGNVNITKFDNAEACIRNLDQEPDVIFLDYSLDGAHAANMNGMEALQHILHHNPNHNVIMMSADENSELLSLCAEQGAFTYVIKSRFTLKLAQHLISKLFDMRPVWDYLDIAI